MDFVFWDIFKIAGALAFFIYGMKVMSDGIQRAAGDQFRHILRTLTQNKFIGAITGFFTTAAVQSSSATTVMTVSLVNAGIITLVQSVGLMMGANVGTTITAWIIAGLGFQVNLQEIILPLLVIGVPMVLRKQGQIKYYGEFIIGFAILFLGLNFLNIHVPDIQNNQEIIDWFRKYTDTDFSSRVLFLLIGGLITIVIQSSSAAMALTLTLCQKGWLPYELGAAMVLGENIGTTATAEIASLVGNITGKRSARIHSLFNTIGVIWMMLLMPYFLDIISKALLFIGFDNPYLNAETTPFGLAVFHTTFNVLNVLLLIGFSDYLVKLAIFTRPEKQQPQKMSFKFIKNTTLTAELATPEIKMEVAHFGDIVSRMVAFTKNLINATNNDQRQKYIKLIKKQEKISDTMEVEISTYVTKISSEELTQRTSIRLRSFINMCNDMERIGDIFKQIALELEQKNKNQIWFSPSQRNALNDLLDLLDLAFKEMIINLDNPHYSNVTLTKSKEIRKNIKLKREALKNEYMGDLDTEELNIRGSLIFYNISTLLEDISNHIYSISESIVGKI